MFTRPGHRTFAPHLALPVLISLALLCPPWAAAQEGQPTPTVPRKGDATPTREDVRKWVKQLGANRFAQRERAAEKLRQAGLAGVEALQDAVISSGDLETSLRAFQVLKQVLQKEVGGKEPAVYQTLEKLASQRRKAEISNLALGLLGQKMEEVPQAKAVLEQLAKSDDAQLAQKAKDVLDPLPKDPRARRYYELAKRTQAELKAMLAEKKQLAAKKDDASRQRLQLLEQRIAVTERRLQIIDRYLKELRARLKR